MTRQMTTMAANPQKVRLAMARAMKDTGTLTRETGLTKNTIVNIAAGNRTRPVNLGKLAQALNVDPADLLADAGELNPRRRDE